MKHIFLVAALCASGVSGLAQPSTVQSNAAAMASGENAAVDSADVFFSHLNLQEVVVTGSTGETQLKNSAAAITVVDERTLMGTAATNVIDAIASQPGVSQVSTGAGISKPVIRGLGYNRIVTVSDGMRQEGQQWGYEHGIEIDGADVASVEVLKGPASLIYGSDALAGVVKFNRRSPHEAGTMGATLRSAYHTNNGMAEYSLSLGANAHSIYWDATYSEQWAREYKNRHDGYVPGSQWHERAIAALVGTNRSWGKSRITFTHYHNTPGIIEGERDEATGELVSDYGKLKTYRHGMPFQHVYHTKVVTDNTLYLGAGRLNIMLGYQLNRRQEFEESATHYDMYLKLSTLNYNIHYTSGNLGGWRFTTGAGGMWQANGNHGDEYLIPDYRLLDIGVFATAQRGWERLTLTGGVRLDRRHISADELLDDGEVRFEAFKRNFTGCSGSVGAVFHASQATTLRLNVARGFRAPAISELSARGVHEGALRYEVGDNKLKPEFSTQLDLGMDVTTSMVALQVALFTNRIGGYIFLQRDGGVVDDMPVFNYTGGTAQLTGGEVTLDFHPLHCLHVGTAFSMVNAVQLHHHGDSRYLPLTPAPRWVTDVKYELNHHGKMFCNSYVSLALDYNFKQSKFYGVNDTETATPAYALLNATVGTQLNYRGKHVATLVITASNLTDKVYQSHLSRLKAADADLDGRRGVFNMGRNVIFKVTIPLTWGI